MEWPVTTMSTEMVVWKGQAEKGGREGEMLETVNEGQGDRASAQVPKEC